MKPLNFSMDNLANQWKYLKRNLQDLGIWQDLEFKARQLIKFNIETVLLEEFALYMQAGCYQRTNLRKDYRSGFYKRSLLTTFDSIPDIKLPKAKKLRPQFKAIKKYQQRQEKFDQMIILSLILGLSTSKQRQFFKHFFKSAVSPTPASKLLKKLEQQLNAYRNQLLKDDYVYLILDAIWIHIKEPNIRNRPVLFALGIKGGGRI